jgi:hypothetical protein
MDVPEEKQNLVEIEELMQISDFDRSEVAVKPIYVLSSLRVGVLECNG